MGEQAAVGALTSPEGPSVTVRNGQATACVVLTDRHAISEIGHSERALSTVLSLYSGEGSLQSPDSFLPGLTGRPFKCS